MYEVVDFKVVNFHKYIILKDLRECRLDTVEVSLSSFDYTPINIGDIVKANIHRKLVLVD